MTIEELQLAAIQFHIKQMGLETETKVTQAATVIKAAVKEHGDCGVIALALVGCELNALKEDALNP